MSNHCFVITDHDNTGDDEVNCDVIGELQVTYHSVLTVKVVSAGVVLSGCQKAGE